MNYFIDVEPYNFEQISRAEKKLEQMGFTWSPSKDTEFRAGRIRRLWGIDNRIYYSSSKSSYAHMKETEDFYHAQELVIAYNETETEE